MIFSPLLINLTYICCVPSSLHAIRITAKKGCAPGVLTFFNTLTAGLCVCPLFLAFVGLPGCPWYPAQSLLPSVSSGRIFCLVVVLERGGRAFLLLGGHPPLTPVSPPSLGWDRVFKLYSLGECDVERPIQSSCLSLPRSLDHRLCHQACFTPKRLRLKKDWQLTIFNQELKK